MRAGLQKQLGEPVRHSEKLNRRRSITLMHQNCVEEILSQIENDLRDRLIVKLAVLAGLLADKEILLWVDAWDRLRLQKYDSFLRANTAGPIHVGRTR